MASQLLSLGAPLVIDDFAYPSTTTARWAWSAVSAPPVTMAMSGEWGEETVMTLPCDFATREGRCYWDRSVTLNLAAYTDFALELFAPDPGAISHFTLYFRSGAGWYGRPVSLSQAGWQRLRFTRSEFTPEGTPAGWDKVDGIRLSPWKGASRNTYLALRELRAYTPEVLLLRDALTSNPDIVQQTLDRHRDWLGRYGLECGGVSRAEVEGGLLAGARLVVLPYNENISSNEWTALENFVAAGGKLLVYYLLPSRMEPLLGVRRTGWAQGDYATWVFSDPAIPALPSRVQQASWNITFAVPNGTLNSRVIATWEDSPGVHGPGGMGAERPQVFRVARVVGDDAEKQSYALLCLLGWFLPDAWPRRQRRDLNPSGGWARIRVTPKPRRHPRGRRTTLRAPRSRPNWRAPPRAEPRFAGGDADDSRMRSRRRIRPSSIEAGLLPALKPVTPNSGRCGSTCHRPLSRQLGGGDDPLPPTASRPSFPTSCGRAGALHSAVLRALADYTITATDSGLRQRRHPADSRSMFGR
jgi:hypothetical protein